MDAWKVVNIDDGTMYSASRQLFLIRKNDTMQDMVLTYKVGETTTPTFGKIYAFETYEQALSWAEMLSSGDNWAIIKGHGKKCERTRAPIRVWKYVRSFRDIEKWWKNTNIEYENRMSYNLPEGSVNLFDFTTERVVTLLERERKPSHDYKLDGHYLKITWPEEECLEITDQKNEK